MTQLRTVNQSGKPLFGEEVLSRGSPYLARAYQYTRAGQTAKPIWVGRAMKSVGVRGSSGLLFDQLVVPQTRQTKALLETMPTFGDANTTMSTDTETIFRIVKEPPNE